MSKAIVWSKDNCPYCEQAKALLKMKGFSDDQIEVRKVGREYTKEQLLESVPSARTVPQIFIDDVYIGDFTQLKSHFQKAQ